MSSIDQLSDADLDMISGGHHGHGGYDGYHNVNQSNTFNFNGNDVNGPVTINNTQTNSNG